MTEPLGFGAVDLGASSGRVFRGTLDGGRLRLHELARFANRPVSLPDGLRWDAARLFEEAIAGLRRAGELRSIGVDSWGVDYSLIAPEGRSDGLPFHYRDWRTATTFESALTTIGGKALYGVTGTQLMPINTVFQLLAEPAAALQNRRLLMVSDLLAYWFSGEAANERTQASTTGLLDAQLGEWAEPLIARLQLPRGLFGPLIDPGTELGPVRPELGVSAGTVVAVAGHDTASAFVAAPLQTPAAAVLSSGTWSLVGVELSEPVLGEDARAANLSNERGLDGTIRLLRNVMGLWLEQECARAWRADHEELQRAAAAADPSAPVFDPDHPSLLRSGIDMPERIIVAWHAAGQHPGTADPATVVRSIHLSLACKYRFVLEQLEAVTGLSIDRIHVIGGGARVSLLCQLTAEITGREVVAGPVEASAIGNVLVQARTAGELSSLDQMRAIVADSVPLSSYFAEDPEAGEEHYQRFLEQTRLRSPVPTRTPAKG